MRKNKLGKITNVGISEEMHKKICEVNEKTDIPIRHIVEKIFREHFKKNGGK